MDGITIVCEELNEFGQCSGWKSSMALKWDLALQNIPLSK
jgi:hypothetical protein